MLNVKTPDFGLDILKIFDDLYTPGADPALLGHPDVQFGGALATAKDIITALQEFLPDVPPMSIDVSAPTLSDSSLRVRIAAQFPIAAKDGSAIDIGIGKFRGALGVGTHSEKNSHETTEAGVHRHVPRTQDFSVASWPPLTSQGLRP